MVNLLWTEALLVTIVGLFTRFLFPSLVGREPSSGLFWAGTLMGLTFTAFYAVSVLAGSRMNARFRIWVSVLSGLLVLWDGCKEISTLAGLEGEISGAEVYLRSASTLLGVLLVGLAVARARTDQRSREAIFALYAYSFPLLILRWLLFPVTHAIGLVYSPAFQAGILYMALRGLVRLFWFRESGYSR